MTRPLGILRSGPCAVVDDRGTVAPTGVEWTVRWWVAGEARWHRPDVDAAVRQRLVDDTPVVETTVRVPGGDAIGFAYGYAAGGDAAWAGRVSNASPVPVAAAVVIGPARSVVVTDSLVVVDGRHTVQLSRKPSATAAAATLDALAEVLPTSTTVNPAASGYVAIVVPLPHTQAVSWQVVDDGVELTPLPDPDQVSAGWVRHAEEGAQLSLPPAEETAFVRSRHLVALGVDLDGPIIDVAQQVSAAVRLGWFDAALEGTERLALIQRARGRIGDDEQSTAAALDALASWRRAGIPAAGLEHLIGPVVSASRWLDRRIGRLDPAGRRAADDALRAAAAFCRLVDQPDVADHLEKITAQATVPRTRGRWSDSSMTTVSGLVDALVDDDSGGVRLLDGWSVAWAREPIEASGVPTPWGTASFALRWHGARPALLWEVEPWPDVARAEPTLRARSLDPSWQGSGWRGDALLAETALPSAVAADGSFS